MLLLYMALRACPLVLSPQTIGPYSWVGSRWLARLIIDRCAKVYARDDLSKDYLSAIGVVKNTDVAIDVAFALPYERVNLPGNKIKVGVNVSGLLYNGGYSGNNMFGLKFNYSEFTRQLLEKLGSIDDCQVYLVPHVTCDEFSVDDDYRVCQDLQRQFPSTVLAPVFTNPIEAKSYISAMDFFTGPRMHACIAAYSSGVPVVPISYSRKFNGLFNSLNFQYLVDGLADDGQSALNKIFHAFENRNKLASDILQGNLLAKNKMEHYRVFVTNLMGKIASESV